MQNSPKPEAGDIGQAMSAGWLGTEGHDPGGPVTSLQASPSHPLLPFSLQGHPGHLPCPSSHESPSLNPTTPSSHPLQPGRHPSLPLCVPWPRKWPLRPPGRQEVSASLQIRPFMSPSMCLSLHSLCPPCDPSPGLSGPSPSLLARETPLWTTSAQSTSEFLRWLQHTARTQPPGPGQSRETAEVTGSGAR